MNESTNPKPTDEREADETFAWTNDPPDGAKDPGTWTAANILESVREAVDELAERAAPVVRELSARAAELTAIAADRAAPLAKRAGEATAEASGKLASMSREWASDMRATVDTAAPGSEAVTHAATSKAKPADSDQGGSATTEEPGPG